MDSNAPKDSSIVWPQKRLNCFCRFSDTAVEKFALRKILQSSSENLLKIFLKPSAFDVS